MKHDFVHGKTRRLRVPLEKCRSLVLPLRSAGPSELTSSAVEGITRDIFCFGSSWHILRKSSTWGYAKKTEDDLPYFFQIWWFVQCTRMEHEWKSSRHDLRIRIANFCTVNSSQHLRHRWLLPVVLGPADTSIGFSLPQQKSSSCLWLSQHAIQAYIRKHCAVGLIIQNFS